MRAATGDLAWNFFLVYNLITCRGRIFGAESSYNAVNYDNRSVTFSFRPSVVRSRASSRKNRADEIIQ